MKNFIWIALIGALTIGGVFAWSQVSEATAPTAVEIASNCACSCGAECACVDCSKDANCSACKANDGCAPRGECPSKPLAGCGDCGK